MTEGSSISRSYAGINADDDVYEPSEILVHHIGENAVCSGEGGSSCEDGAPTNNLYPPTMQPLETPESMPSVERRRRRRQTKNMIHNDYNLDDDFIPITSRRGWREDAWLKYDTAILGILLFLAIRLLSLRDKIMQDIRHSRQEALTNDIFLPRYIRQIPRIASILLKNALNGDIFQQLKRLITNPLQSHHILFEVLISIWDIVGDSLQQLQYFLSSLPILRILFGAGVMIIGDEVVSDVVPELDEKANSYFGLDHDNEASAANSHATIYATKAGLKPVSVVREIRYDIKDLPPAFENEEDYPPGWLMYHPKHGVRTREFLMELEGEKIEVTHQA